MSTEMVPAPSLTSVSRVIQQARRLDTDHEAGTLAARNAQGLLPATLLQGCREIVQRISPSGSRSLGVTSAVRGEGRSSVAAGIALVEWLDHERRTVLIDLDLTSPSLHQHFGLSEGPGINDLTEGHVNVEDYLQPIVGDVWLLSAGRSNVDAPRAVSRLAGSTILSQLSEWADTIVFDLPPLLGSPDGIAAARLCATPIMVVRAGATPIPQVSQAVELLVAPPPVVLNGVRSAMPRWLRRALGAPR
jgi:Mrp family chromosome partitioning ATPase